jgi:Transmembrane domain of unknown function (DUF3566)
VRPAVPPSGRSPCVHWAVVSPSKRAGDTVDEGVDQARPGANGNGHAEDGSNGNGRPRRRSVVSPANAAGSAERGSSSARGTSSSSITKRSLTGSPSTFPEDEAPAAEEPASSVTPPVVPIPTPSPPPEPTVDASATTNRPGPAAVAAAMAAAASATTSAAAATGDAESAGPAPSTAPAAVVVPPPTARVDPSSRGTAGTGEQAVVAVPLPITMPPGPTVAPGPPAQRGTGELTRPDDPMAPPESPYVSSTMSAHQVAPVPRLLGRRPRVRRVTRVVRHVDPWSIFKVSLVFNLVLYVVMLTAGVLLWNVAYATGTVDNLERFFESFGWSTFEFHGGAIFHAAWIAGLFGVIGLTGAAVLAATLFNLITDLVGGIRMTVLEEEVQERTMAPMRRFVVRRPTAPTGGDPSNGLRREVDRLPDPPSPPTEF